MISARIIVAFSALAAWICAAGCREKGTQLLLFVESEASRTEVSSFSVEVITGDGAIAGHSWMRGDGARSLGIVARENEDLPVILMIRGTGTSTRNLTITVDRFVKNETMKIYACVEARCTSADPCAKNIPDLSAIDEARAEEEFLRDCKPPVEVDGGVVEDAGDPDPADSGLEPADAGDRDAEVSPEFPVVISEPWSAKISTNGDDTITDVAIDARGNVYVSGISSGAGFLARYSSLGALQWMAPIESAGTSSIAAIALGDNGDLYATGALSEDAELLGVRVSIGGKPEPLRALVVVRLDIAAPEPRVTHISVNSGSELHGGAAIAVDHRNMVHVAGRQGSDGVFWAVFDQNLTAHTFAARFSATGSVLAGDLVASHETSTVHLAGTFKGMLSLDGDALPLWVANNRNLFIATRDEMDKVTVRRIGGNFDEEDPRLAAEPSGELHVAAHYETTPVFAVETSFVTLNFGETAVDLALGADPADTSGDASVAIGNADDTRGRGVAYLAGAGQTIVGINYRGTLKLHETSMYNSVNGTDDVLLAVYEAGVPKNSWIFTGEGKEELNRVRASEVMIAAVGSFDAAINCPNGDRLESGGGTDAFIYVLPPRN